jgi:hypothetical protein
MSEKNRSLKEKREQIRCKLTVYLRWHDGQKLHAGKGIVAWVLFFRPPEAHALSTWGLAPSRVLLPSHLCSSSYDPSIIYNEHKGDELAVDLTMGVRHSVHRLGLLGYAGTATSM